LLRHWFVLLPQTVRMLPSATPHWQTRRLAKTRLLAAQAASVLGGIDTVVLSASIQVHKSFLAMPPEDVARQFQINLTANIELLQHLLPGMRAQGWGRVISIGSIQELAPSAEMPIYAMTKAALENLVRNLAVENAAYGITVNNIAPGLIETDRNAFRRQDMDDWKRLTRRANPMQRAGQPHDIAGAALFLASGAASFVTAATIHVTGGAHVPRAANDPLNDAKLTSNVVSQVESAPLSI
jgi:NAD(P)-dependent dehydrogenase (short-subunit alcohol dehydrogenase family)